MYKLIIEDEEGNTTIVPLVKDEITIGRKDGNTIRLTERNISRHHARLIKNDGSVFIEDLDSYNGVKVNGERIAARTNLQEGDLIEIGDYNFALQWLEDEPPWKSHSMGMTAVTRELVVQQQDRTTAVMRLPVEDPRRCKRLPVLERDEIAPERAARLIANWSKSKNTEFDLHQRHMVIGSGPDCDIRLSHASIVPHHAVVTFDGTGYAISALEEDLPVTVNGQSYNRVELRSKDLIELGRVKLRFLDPDGIGSYGEEDEDSTMHEVPTREMPLPKEMSAEKKKKWIPLVVIFLFLAVAAAAYLIYRHYNPTRSQQAESRPGKLERRSEPQKIPSRDEPPGSTAQQDYEQGKKKLEAGDLAAAEAKLREALSKAPKHVQAKRLMEDVERERKAEKKLDEIKKAVAIGRYDRAWKMLSSVPAGTKAAEQAKEMQPGLLEQYKAFLLQEASQAKEASELEEALIYLDQVLGLEPDNTFAIHLKQSVLGLQKKSATQNSQAGETVRAKAGGSKAEKIGRRNRNTETNRLMNKAMQAFEAGRYPESITHLKEVIWLNPAHCSALKNIATCYAREEQMSEAESYYQKFVDMCPRHKDVEQVQLILDQVQQMRREQQPQELP